MNKIGIGFEEKCNTVDKPADTEQTGGEEIQDAHADLSFVEFMGTKIAQEYAQQEGDPLVLGAQTCYHRDSVGILVGVCIRVGIVDNDVGLFLVFDFFDLAATMSADHRSTGDLVSAMLTELGVFQCAGSGLGRCISVHAILPF